MKEMSQTFGRHVYKLNVKASPPFYCTILIGIPKIKAALFNSFILCPTPIAQWCEGPALLHCYIKPRTPQGKR